MIRYMSIDKTEDREFDTAVAYEIESPVFILDKNPLKVPYIKLDIKIVGKEERYMDDRKPATGDARQRVKGQRTPRKSVIRICGDMVKQYLGGTG